MSLNNTQNNTQFNLTLNNHPNRNYYIENYDMLVCNKCLQCHEEEELVVCNQCHNIFCERRCYYGRNALNQDTCLECWVYKKCIYWSLMRCFDAFIEEVKIDGFLLDNELSIFNKPKPDYKFSNLMRILFNEYKIEFWDDDERRLKDRTNALLVFKNMKKYIPYDIQRHITQNYL